MVSIVITVIKNGKMLRGGSDVEVGATGSRHFITFLALAMVMIQEMVVMVV